MRSRLAKKSSTGLEFEQPLAELAALQHLGFQLDDSARRGKTRTLADGHFAPRPHQRPPSVLACGLGQHHFDAARSASPSRAAACAAQKAAPESRGCRSAPADRPRARNDGKSANIASRSAPRGAIHHQHAARAALGRRLLRNQFLRQVVIEIRHAQIAIFAHACPRCRKRIHARAFQRRIQLRASGLHLSPVRSAGTRVHCAQLTTMRVNGLGTRKRSQELITHARSG